MRKSLKNYYKIIKITMNTTLEQIKNHLEFLGYIVEIIKPEGENKIWGATAKHSRDNSLIITEVAPSIFFFRAILTTERAPSPEADKYINEINSKSDVCRTYYTIENNLMILNLECIYLGDYNKLLFSKFIELMTGDHKRMALLNGFSEAFIKNG